MTLGAMFLDHHWVHELKCWPEHFEPMSKGAKTHEVRVNDRDYKVGDVLYLREWAPLVSDYTGRFAVRVVTHLLKLKEVIPELNREEFPSLQTVALSLRMPTVGELTSVDLLRRESRGGLEERNTMNRDAFRRIVAEDIEWLERQPDSLEKSHIMHVLRDAPSRYYDEDPRVVELRRENENLKKGYLT